jgi:hypothetical protein
MYYPKFERRNNIHIMKVKFRHVSRKEDLESDKQFCYNRGTSLQQ